MDRKIAKALAKKYIEESRPLDWFEELYKQAMFNNRSIPWADLLPNPNLVEWVKNKPISYFDNKKILKIGCGLGDDSEFWSAYSENVNAFDISPTAIEWCKKRFPTTKVNYFEADLLTLSESYYGMYDIVQESYTLQVLPKKEREIAIALLPKLLKSNGSLILICRGREENDYEGDMPFPITKSELQGLEQTLTVIKFEDYADKEVPPVRRFRVEYTKKITKVK